MKMFFWPHGVEREIGGFTVEMHCVPKLGECVHVDLELLPQYWRDLPSPSISGRNEGEPASFVIDELEHVVTKKGSYTLLYCHQDS